MPDKQPIEYTGRVLDQRNDLTGPDDNGKASYPKRPKDVSIQQSTDKRRQ
ncbi:hypothetical protein ACFFHH_06555 [Cytobacillus solani]|nr:hypothetical protein [Cytobacillus solani]USK53205.1 hypothetical protein LIS82_16480 [Cytobacillus solani]